MCLASTWIVDRRGLRAAIFIGAILTFLGGLVRAISSFPGIGEHISRSSISFYFIPNSGRILAFFYHHKESAKNILTTPC